MAAYVLSVAYAVIQKLTAGKTAIIFIHFFKTTMDTTVIEINGVKLEVDLRHAKRIDTLRIGDRVKCLIKDYSSFNVYPGVVVGFEPFSSLPSIVVAYLVTDYSAASLKFKTFNSQTTDFEIVPDLDNTSLEVNKESILKKFDQELSKLKNEEEIIRQKRQFFLDNFGLYFSPQE